ncbi:MAG: hypothetical protein LWW93_10490 [Hyphomicrobiales bacterium]|nr:hypothetical protein [Hyphomicrobiales bacterium]
MTTIHIFSSTSGSGLFAFTAEAEGGNLPTRHGPWRHMARVPPNGALPHHIDREPVEDAIEKHGFQMWRPRVPKA